MSDVPGREAPAGCWPPVLAWSALVAFVATRPPDFFPADLLARLPVSRGVLEGTLHAAAFGVLAVLLGRCIVGSRLGSSPARTAMLALLGTTVVSVGTELAQVLAPPRTLEASDLAANFLGAVVGLGLVQTRARGCRTPDTSPDRS